MEHLIEVFNYRIYGNFTMETILATAFGRSVDIQRGESDQIVDIAKLMFSGSDEKKGLSFLIIMPLLSEYMNSKSDHNKFKVNFGPDSFPWLESILRVLAARAPIVKSVRTLFSIAKEMVRQRRLNPQPQKVRTVPCMNIVNPVHNAHYMHIACS